MVFFIPWRVVAEESGAAQFDLPGLAGVAVAGFLFSDIPVRGDDGARAIGATDDAAAVELPGRRRTLVVITRARAWAARCQPTCTCSGRLGGAAAANRTMVRSPAAPSLFRFNGLSFRDSGSARPVMTSASPGRGGAGRAQRATGSSTTVAKFRSNDSAG